MKQNGLAQTSGWAGVPRKRRVWALNPDPQPLVRTPLGKGGGQGEGRGARRGVGVGCLKRRSQPRGRGWRLRADRIA